MPSWSPGVAARSEEVRIDGIVREVAVLIGIGVGPDGRRRILGVSVSLSEAEAHWRQFLASLNARGTRRVRRPPSEARRVHRRQVRRRPRHLHLPRSAPSTPLNIDPARALRKRAKRRSRVATLPSKEASLLRLVCAVLIEISDNWETGGVFAAMGEK